MKRLVTLLVIACVVVMGLWLNADVTTVLLLGWLSFLGEVSPRVSVDLPTVELACAAFALFVAGIHWIGVASARRRREQGVTCARWKVRWSLASAAVVIVLFASGICLVGIVHQTAWLLTDEKPRYGEMLKWEFEPRYASSLHQSRMISLGMTSYQDSEREFPAGGTFTAEGEMLHSWETRLLLFMFYAMPELDLSRSWRDERNVAVFRGVVPAFINPGFRVAELKDGEGFGLSHYAANARVLGPNRALKPSEMTNGTANTILIGEVNSNFRPWGHPVNWRDPAKGINRSPDGFGGPPRSGGVNFVMADGSVRFVSDHVDSKVLRALASPRGGDAIEEGAR
jgi:prepilin-type processing-associated H-X9-DG protein